MVMPFFVLTVAYLGEYAIIMRNSLLDVMADDYVTTARAKGVREAGPLATRGPERAAPDVDLTMLSLGFIFGGAITIEYVFSWPGLGWLTVQAIESKDFNLPRRCS